MHARTHASMHACMHARSIRRKRGGETPHTWTNVWPLCMRLTKSLKLLKLPP